MCPSAEFVLLRKGLATQIMIDGFNGYVIMFSVLLSVSLLPSGQLSAECESGVHFEYVCTEQHSLPAGENPVPVIMLHGITDSKETWNEIYQNVSAETGRKVCIYDARNHGGSFWNNTFDAHVLAEDLGNFVNMANIERAVIVGHSMGGITAIRFAVSNPEKVDGLYVEDIGPYVPDLVVEGVRYFLRILEKSLSAIPKEADEPTAKKAVWDYVKRFTFGISMEFLRRNMPLHFRDGVWQWKTNIPVLKKSSEKDVVITIPQVEGQYDGKALFIYSKSSPFEVSEQKEDIRKLFPNARFVETPGKDHFVHFASRNEYMKALLDFLK